MPSCGDSGPRLTRFPRRRYWASSNGLFRAVADHSSRLKDLGEALEEQAAWERRRWVPRENPATSILTEG